LTSVQASVFASAEFESALQLKASVLLSKDFKLFAEMLGIRNLPEFSQTNVRAFAEKIHDLTSVRIDKLDGITLSDFLKSVKTFSQSAADHLREKFVDRHINRVEEEVAKSKKARTADINEAVSSGRQLFSVAKVELAAIQKALGADDTGFVLLRNKAANELLNCSINYFNAHQESDERDPGAEAIELLNLAEQLEPSGEVKDRLESNRPIIQEWVDDQAVRNHPARKEPEAKEALALIKDLGSSNLNGTEVLRIARGVARLLKALRKKIGSDHPYYRSLCTQIFASLIGVSIENVNGAQRALEYSGRSKDDLRQAIWKLEREIRAGRKILRLALSFPLDDQFKTRTEGNLNTVEGLKNNIPWSLWGIRPVESSVIDILFTIPRFIWVTLSKAFNANFGCGILLACFYVYSFIGLSILLQEQIRDFSISLTGDLVYVGGGYFSPGALNGLYDESVTLDSFQIDRYEVSKKQFQQFLDKTSQTSPAAAGFENLGDDRPISNVTIHEARAYCAHQGKRLPTEYEWEWAARDRDRNKDGSLDGSEWDRPFISVDSRLLKQEGNLGLFGMVSSVGEWTEFHFGSSGEKDEQGNYVFPVRGGTVDGSWRDPNLYYSIQQQPNAFIRKLFNGDDRSLYIGFRCAKNID